MSLESVLTIVSVLVGPILAVQAQRWVDILRDRRDRKIRIFKTLMATRAAILSPDHVAALNMIDVEFPEIGRWKPVVRAWRSYFDHLQVQTASPEETARWLDRRIDFLAELLSQMGKSLGYDFDVVKIKRGIYSPKAHGMLEEEAYQIRQGVLAILNGQRAIPIKPIGESDAH